jgi:hypothetical protein
MKNVATLFLGLAAIYAPSTFAHTKYIVEQPTYIMQQPAPVVVVEAEPPADFAEEIGVSPGRDFIWIKGHWQWSGNQWGRVHGHWVQKPHSSAVWVPGCWTRHHHHWKWNEGYWQ